MKSLDARTLLKRGIAAAQAGDIELARILLAQAVQRDPRNEHGWLWLASVLNRPEEIEYCLKRTLSINPDNERARHRLASLAPTPSSVATPLFKRSAPRRLCPSCGAELRRGIRFCERCGAPLVAQAIPDETLEKLLEAPTRWRFRPTHTALEVLFLLRQRRPSIPKRWIIIGGMILLALCALILLILSLKG